MSADDKHLPIGHLAKLIGHQVVKPIPWPKFSTIEAAIKARRGTYQLKQERDWVTATVTVMGQTGTGGGEEANQAATEALIEALDKVFPKMSLPGLDDPTSQMVDKATRLIRESLFEQDAEITVDPDTGEILDGAGELSDVLQKNFDAGIDVAIRFEGEPEPAIDTAAFRSKSNKAMAAAVTAKGDGSAKVVFDEEHNVFRTEQGDVYADGAIEDAARSAGPITV